MISGIFEVKDVGAIKSDEMDRPEACKRRVVRECVSHTRPHTLCNNPFF
jgi:hypothetical protein